MSSPMSSRRIAVVTAGLSVPSSSRLLADRLSAATAAALRAQGLDVTVDVVELREHARQLADHLVTGFPAESLRMVIEQVTGADALIAVTPVFSGSYSGLFKTFFDLLDTGALAGTPVLLGATAGTARHSLMLDHAMRPLFSYLHAVVVPAGVYAAPEDWAGGDGTSVALSARIDRAAAELAALAAQQPGRAATGPFGDVTPMEALLRGL